MNEYGPSYNVHHWTPHLGQLKIKIVLMALNSIMGDYIMCASILCQVVQSGFEASNSKENGTLGNNFAGIFFLVK